MKLQRQTVFSGPDAPLEQRGNCFSTCIACLLDLDVDEVPIFALKPTWFSDMQNWLGVRGLRLVKFDGLSIDAPLIAHGPTVRGTRHSVLRAAGSMIWDPHPSDAGLLEVEEEWMLAILNVSTLVAWHATRAPS